MWSVPEVNRRCAGLFRRFRETGQVVELQQSEENGAYLLDLSTRDSLRLRVWCPRGVTIRVSHRVIRDEEPRLLLAIHTLNQWNAAWNVIPLNLGAADVLEENESQEDRNKIPVLPEIILEYHRLHRRVKRKRMDKINLKENKIAISKEHYKKVALQKYVEGVCIEEDLNYDYSYNPDPFSTLVLTYTTKEQVELDETSKVLVPQQPSQTPNYVKNRKRKKRLAKSDSDTASDDDQSGRKLAREALTGHSISTNSNSHQPNVDDENDGSSSSDESDGVAVVQPNLNESVMDLIDLTG